MKQSRFTEIPVIGILKKADSGIAANETWRNTGLAQLHTTNGSQGTAD
jgi:putative transposase